MAISEAVEAAARDPDAHYSLGSVLNHVLLHQTVIGEEALASWSMVERQRGRRLRLRRRRVEPRRAARSRSCARNLAGGLEPGWSPWSLPPARR